MKDHLFIRQFYQTDDLRNVRREQINTQRSVNQLKDIVQRLKNSKKHVSVLLFILVFCTNIEKIWEMKTIINLLND